MSSDKSEQFKKPIVVAGNGPSLAKIDYRRLPEDFDVFRCNQFYFEDKYYLGKHVTAYFFPKQMIKQQYYNIKILEKNNEYSFENIYYLSDRPDHTLKADFPRIKSTFFYWNRVPVFYELSRFLGIYYTKSFTSGINMLIMAIAMGYKEIYLVGLDFYEGGGQIMLFL